MLYFITKFEIIYYLINNSFKSSYITIDISIFIYLYLNYNIELFLLTKHT